MSSTVQEIMEALADQLRDALPDGYQVEPDLVRSPSPVPVTIDVYPADEFQESLGYGAGNVEFFFTVRARLNTPDASGAQNVLLELMDPRSSASVEAAILEDETLGNNVEFAAMASHASGYGLFADPGNQGQYLGCTWRVRVIP